MKLRIHGSLLILFMLLFLLILNTDIVYSQEFAEKSKLKLWYKQPASNWNEALPVGNGSLGAMIFGGIQKERIQLNEETVWTGEPVDRANPEAKKYLAVVRNLLFEGKYAEAEKLAQEKIMGTRLERGIHTYQTLGDLNRDFGEQQTIRNYRRELDIENAVVRISYVSGKTEFKREIFSSAADRIIVVRITSNVPGTVSLTAGLSRPGDKAEITAEPGVIIMKENNDEIDLTCDTSIYYENNYTTAGTWTEYIYLGDRTFIPKDVKFKQDIEEYLEAIENNIKEVREILKEWDNDKDN